MNEKAELTARLQRWSETLAVITDTKDQFESLVDESEMHLVESAFQFLDARYEQVSQQIRSGNTRLTQILEEERKLLR